MRTRLAITSVVVVALVCLGSPSRGDITYSMANYSDIYNGCTVSGYITTDGHTGILTYQDIKSWLITIDPPEGSDPTIYVQANENPTNSWVDPASVFEATTQNLSVTGTLTDPVNGIYEYLGFGNNTDDSGIEWDTTWLNGTVAELPTTPGNHGISWIAPWPQPPETGVGVIATAVPEPSSLILLAIGAISLLGYCWRRRRAA